MKWLSEFLISKQESALLYLALRKRVKERIIPLLINEGFVEGRYPPKLTPKSRSEKAYTPFGLFRRRRSSHDDLLEIVFDERAYPKFHLHFGRAPHEGVMLWGQTYSFEDMAVCECPETYKLTSKEGVESPFFLWWPFKDDRNIDELVEEAAAKVPQIWDWFDNGRVGANVLGGRNDPVVSDWTPMNK